MKKLTKILSASLFGISALATTTVVATSCGESSVSLSFATMEEVINYFDPATYVVSKEEASLSTKEETHAFLEKHLTTDVLLKSLVYFMQLLTVNMETFSGKIENMLYKNGVLSFSEFKCEYSIGGQEYFFSYESLKNKIDTKEFSILALITIDFSNSNGENVANLSSSDYPTPTATKKIDSVFTLGKDWFPGVTSWPSE